VVVISYFHKRMDKKWRTKMAECEVQSPVSRKGSKVGSGQPQSPGAFSSPSRGRTDSIPARPSYGASGHSAEPGEVKITSPEE
jgi:hypothetical protein